VENECKNKKQNAFSNMSYNVRIRTLCFLYHKQKFVYNECKNTKYFEKQEIF